MAESTPGNEGTFASLRRSASFTLAVSPPAGGATYERTPVLALHLEHPQRDTVQLAAKLRGRIGWSRNWTVLSHRTMAPMLRPDMSWSHRRRCSRADCIS
jgi:hypothetical protein